MKPSQSVLPWFLCSWVRHCMVVISFLITFHSSWVAPNQKQPLPMSSAREEDPWYHIWGGYEDIWLLTLDEGTEGGKCDALCHACACSPRLPALGQYVPKAPWVGSTFIISDIRACNLNYYLWFFKNWNQFMLSLIHIWRCRRQV